MRRTTELLSELPRRSERWRGRQAAPRGRARTGVVLVTAFAAFSTAGLLMPEAAGAATHGSQPSVRIVLPPATVRNSLPPIPVKPPLPVKPVATPDHVSTKVLSVTPAQGATNVSEGQRITVNLSAPPMAGAPCRPCSPRSLANGGSTERHLRSWRPRAIARGQPNTS